VDTAPLAGEHAGCLAVEQIFGYMVRNGKTYGILTTMKGWCFLSRANGGMLYMTRMYGDFATLTCIQSYTTPWYKIIVWENVG
jgi:hypothetical protein